MNNPVRSAGQADTRSPPTTKWLNPYRDYQNFRHKDTKTLSITKQDSRYLIQWYVVFPPASRFEAQRRTAHEHTARRVR